MNGDGGATLLSDCLVRFRHELHAYPELSGAERETAARVVRMLNELTSDTTAQSSLHTGLGGGHGLLYVLDFATGSRADLVAGDAGGDALGRSRTLVFRCELDAVPVPEVPSGEQCKLSYSSVVPDKVAHKCGHDGHMAMLLGLAARLAHGQTCKAMHEARCRVALLFQAAEETAQGGLQVLRDKRFITLRPDFLLALHNQPGYPVGTVLARAGTAACGSVGLVVQLTGVSSHACFPERGLSPSGAVARIIVALEGLKDHPSAAGRLAFATVVHVQVGEPEAFGVAPGFGVVMATIRADDAALLAELKESAELCVRDIARIHGLQAAVGWQDAFGVTVNDAAVVRLVEAAARACELPFTELSEPMRWAEDFGFVLDRFTHGALVCLGSGEAQAALHHPSFDFPDKLIDQGVDLLERVALAAALPAESH